MPMPCLGVEMHGLCSLCAHVMMHHMNEIASRSHAWHMIHDSCITRASHDNSKDQKLAVGVKGEGATFLAPSCFDAFCSHNPRASSLHTTAQSSCGAVSDMSLC